VPTITDYRPSTALTAGGIAFTIIGSSLGSTGAAVTVGSNDCTPVSLQNHTHIICTLPAGFGSSREVKVVVASLVSRL